jgi:hypothetical protein
MIYDIWWFGELLAVIMIVSSYSFWWKRTVLFRFAMSLYVAVSVGYATAVSISSINSAVIYPLMSAKYIMIIPLLIGFLFFARLSKQFAFLSRWPVALMLGVGIPIALTGAISSYIVANLTSTMLSISTDPWAFLNLIFLVAGLYYFIFFKKSREFRGASGIVRIGRVGIMLSFGINLAYAALNSATNLWFWINRVILFIARNLGAA